MAKFRDLERTNYIIQNWMKTRNTIEFLGLWEQLKNQDFKSIEFDAFRNESGSNSFTLTPKKWLAYAEEADLFNVALLNCTAKDWRDTNPDLAQKSLNIRDIASINYQF